MKPLTIRLAVFDWAGTCIDFGCFAPVSAFVAAFASEGVLVSDAQARVPMGLHKRDHIRCMLEMPEVIAAWDKVKGQTWIEGDVERLFQSFIPKQMEVIGDHCELIPGVLETVAELRERGIAIGSTTGYFREAAMVVRKAAADAGYVPDASYIPEDVSAGRPHPWMIFRIMEDLKVSPPATVVKIGDTIPDVDEARNAGVWSIGITLSGSEIGMTQESFAALPLHEQTERLAKAEDTLRQAGAHLVIPTVADLPAAIDELNRRLAAGERP